jgi:hypothetical protein
MAWPGPRRRGRPGDRLRHLTAGKAPGRSADLAPETDVASPISAMTDEKEAGASNRTLRVC